MNLSETDFLIITTTFIILIILLMMISLYGIFVRKKSELLLAQQKKQALFEQELATSQMEIKEQTLNYIGQELHDDLGQKLSVARLMTNKILISSADEKDETAKEANLLIGECIQDIRNLSKILITNQVEHFGFAESLEREISRIQKLDYLQVEYSNNNRDAELDSNHALILFRITQECVNNVIKHSKAKKMNLVINDTPDFMEIRIHDNGTGFNENLQKEGSGLKNMKNRAKIINGELSIHSSENEGTEVWIKYKK